MPYKNYEKQKAFQREYSREKTKLLHKLKNKPCSDCGQTFPPYVMDWDHRPGERKFKGLASMIRYKYERCLEEISKCDLVCANCHRVRTFNRQKLK